MHPRVPFKLRYLDDNDEDGLEEIGGEALAREDETTTRYGEALAREDETTTRYGEALARELELLKKAGGLLLFVL
jgi:hypothetical protein